MVRYNVFIDTELIVDNYISTELLSFPVQPERPPPTQGRKAGGTNWNQWEYITEGDRDMGRRIIVLTVALLCVFTLAASALAGGDTKLKYKGVYTAWAQSQHDFKLGNGDYDDNYAVQMLRMMLDFEAAEGVHAVTRFDMAQGWWGVDNADRTVNRTGKIGGSSLFDYKDTNFLFHVDQAYIVFAVPDTKLKAKVGRMWYGLGNKIVLDNNFDGVQFVYDGKFTLGFAKVSEGVDGLSDIDNSGTGGADAQDANLFTGQFKGATSSTKYELYGLVYRDAGGDDGTTYLPNDINYFRSRFTPNISDLNIFGAAGKWKSGGFTLNGEFNVLSGKDNVTNAFINDLQLTDMNDGDISGYNLYLKGNKTVNSSFDVGGVFGMGSGDDDWTGGAGNVNKLRTSGFFYVTEIWEDSIMPDEEGITPQGLGAPNVRGYRELENTTLFQLNATYKFSPKVSLFGSFTSIKATEAIHEWMKVTNDNGTPGDLTDDYDETVVGTASSTDIGTEIDWKLVWKIYPNLTFAFRGGVFTPGDAAGYLINGTPRTSRRRGNTRP